MNKTKIIFSILTTIWVASVWVFGFVGLGLSGTTVAGLINIFVIIMLGSMLPPLFVWTMLYRLHKWQGHTFLLLSASVLIVLVFSTIIIRMLLKFL